MTRILWIIAMLAATTASLAWAIDPDVLQALLRE